VSASCHSLSIGFYKLLVGIVAWYIGAQKGLGNPYGVVAATVVLSAPFLLGRIAAPPQELMVGSILYYLDKLLKPI
jgi:hypothetical protein